MTDAHQRSEPRIEFLGEQDGAPERQLKAVLRKELGQFPSIQRAYLARIGFAPEAPPSVALCVVPRSEDERAIVDHVARVFAAQFSKDTHLDIIFPSNEQEADLRRVCQPFFEAEP